MVIHFTGFEDILNYRRKFYEKYYDIRVLVGSKCPNAEENAEESVEFISDNIISSVYRYFTSRKGA
jgi:hypothetical protein